MLFAGLFFLNYDTNNITCNFSTENLNCVIVRVAVLANDILCSRLPYEYLVGGVFVLRTEHFQQLNGYSNSYWGWGAEDDDMSVR